MSVKINSLREKEIRDIGDACAAITLMMFAAAFIQNKMITTVEEAISELSLGMTLKAGTIIATGTPGGVGMEFNPPKYLKHGTTTR